MKPLRVTEVFYSLQGEGRRAGEPSVFVRLSGCSAKHACFARGVLCDTSFEAGEDTSPEALLQQVQHVSGLCRWVIWTGGEPLDQLTPDVLQMFVDAGYKNAVETSGIRPMTEELYRRLAWISLSPKVAEHVLAKHFHEPVSELRYVLRDKDALPVPSVRAYHHYLSPHAVGDLISKAALDHCLQLCLANPHWALSMQQHKVWGVR